MPGVKLRYTAPNNGLVLIPLMHKPLFFDSLHDCPLCLVTHPVKTVHLWLDGADHVLVSTGVLEDLEKAGMPDLVKVETIDNPPPLSVGRYTREQVDQTNRRVLVHSPTALTAAAKVLSNGGNRNG